MIKPLTGTGTATILTAFNEAFSDYVVPLKLTEEQLAGKFRRENINLELSAGAYDGDQLAGFILHGAETRQNGTAAYNAATGVIPSYRGQRLTRRLYGAILPTLRAKGVREISLEVITTNIPALKTYKEMGFQVSRRLLCYKGKLELGETRVSDNVQLLEHIDWDLLKLFGDWEPTWQHAAPAIRRMGGQMITIGYITAGQIVGFACYDPVAHRVAQVAVKPDCRRQGIATALFAHLSSRYGPDMSVINVDAAAVETQEFIRKAGLREFIQQYEMVLQLD